MKHRLLVALASLYSREHQPYNLAATTFLVQIASAILFLSVISKYLPEILNTSLAVPGYLMAAYGVSRLVSQTPAGWLADRLGRRRTLVAGLVISLAPLGLMMVARDARFFYPLVAFYGLTTSLVWPSLYAIIADDYAVSSRGRIMGLLNLAQIAGLGLGAFGGSLIVTYLSYAAAFVACLLLYGLAVALALAHRQPHRHRQGAQPQPVYEATPELRALTRAPVLLLGGVAIFLSLAGSSLAPALVPYVQRTFDREMHELVVYLIPLGAVAGLAMVPMGHLSDRMERRVPLVAGLAAGPLALFALTNTESLWLAVSLGAAVALAFALSLPAWNAAVMDHSEPHNRGTLFGFMATLQGLGTALGPALGGQLAELWGPRAAFQGAAALMALAFLVALVYARRRQRENRPP